MASEFILVLPIAVMMILVMIDGSITGTRAVLASYANTRAARVASVYQDEYADLETRRILPSLLFTGSNSEILDGRITTLAGANAVFSAGLPSFVRVTRHESARSGVLPAGLSDETLQGGDTPSPYCIKEGGYDTCGIAP